MLNVVKNFFKSSYKPSYKPRIISDKPIITSLGVKMRKPFNKEGKWIGWTSDEVAEHLSATRAYYSTVKKTTDGNGC